jgi:hypothetical protein
MYLSHPLHFLQSGGCLRNRGIFKIKASEQSSWNGRSSSRRSSDKYLYTLDKNGEYRCPARQRLRKQSPVSSHHRKPVMTSELRKANTKPIRMPLGKRPSGCEPFGWPARPMRLALRHQKGRQDEGLLIRRFLRRAESRLLYERFSTPLAYPGLFSGPIFVDDPIVFFGDAQSDPYSVGRNCHLIHVQRSSYCPRTNRE